MEKQKLVLVSLLDILPYLPVQHFTRDMKDFELITHATIHHRKKWRGEEQIAFHTPSEISNDNPWWWMQNTRNAVGGMVTHITLEEAERIGIKHVPNDKYPDHITESLSLSTEETRGDTRPAARESAQTIIY